MNSPWLDPLISVSQRVLVDRQLESRPWPPHFVALAEAVRNTQCPGVITEIGCGSGYGREILDRAGVPYRSFSGVDINPRAIELAKERYPESEWWLDRSPEDGRGWPLKADVIIDGSCLLHIDKWREHLAALCKASRRWVVLHRVPLATETQIAQTHGYGHVFPARVFNGNDIHAEMEKHGFIQTAAIGADGYSHTLTYAKPRHFCSYADRNYLTRLKALHASMVRHCGPFALHCLSFDDAVDEWCVSQKIDSTHVDDFIEQRPELAIDALSGPKRTRVEHMYTVGPAFVAATMEKTGEPCTYVDSDVRLFSSPEPLFAEAGGAPAAFVGHNFASASQGLMGPTIESHAGPFGSLNVGVCVFNDVHVAQRWAELVRGWCFNRCELVDGRWQYADQKYLEQLTDEFGAVVAKNPAAMCGPWNLHSRCLDVRDGHVFFGNRPLIAYHFSSLVLGSHGYLQIARPEYRISERQIGILYADYVREIDAK